VEPPPRRNPEVFDMALAAAGVPSVKRTVLSLAFAAAAVGFPGHSPGQTTPTSPAPSNPQLDLNAILQALGGLGNFGGFGAGTTGGTTTGGTTTSDTTTAGTGGGSSGGTVNAAPSIVEDQFTTTSTGSIRQRSPGQYVRQAIAMQNGEIDLPGNGPAEEQNFYRDTAQQVILAVIDLFSTTISGLNALFSLNAIDLTPDGTTGGSTATIMNPTTTGAGTTTQLE